jgi:ribokinase
MASIVVDDQARNCILVVPGANLGLSPDDVRAAGDWIRSAALLLCQLEVPLETTQEALRIAREAGVRTVLNPAPAVPLPEELLQLADLCVPNETELELLTGQRVSSLEAAAAAAWTLLERGPQQVIVTLGERGVLLADARSVEHIPALPVEAVDPTGAGDAFIGGLAVFLAEGLALPDAVRCANAVAALSVSRPGTQTALPTRAEADAFLRRAGR